MHKWKFARIGGFDQPLIENGDDLAAVPTLDKKLWAALACPATDLEFDGRTLALIDTNGDGRIHADELVQAIEWATARLRPHAAIASENGLALTDVDVAGPEGKHIVATAQKLLADLGKAAAERMTVGDIYRAKESFEKQTFNGDGVVSAAAAAGDASIDDEARALIATVIDCAGGRADRAGGDGIDAASVAAFFTEITAYAAWLARGEADPAVLPLGAASLEAYGAFVTVRAKVDDFFARSRIAAFDPRALAAVNREETDYLAIVAKDLDVTASEIRAFPLAKVAPAAPLPLVTGVNPAWQSDLAAFRARVVTPLIGERSVLSEGEWAEIKLKLAALDAWRAEKHNAKMEKLAPARVRELASGGSRAKLEALIARDVEAKLYADAIDSVERLVRYATHLLPLARNFVSFHDFYDRAPRKAGAAPATGAVFQAGTLYIDNRACELCIRVNDAERHASMAPLANLYLLYCECRAEGEKPMSIAAAVTGGDVDNLMVGRNGLFYDRKHPPKVWQARVTRIVENPIGIRQAFWAPYKKAIRVVEEQVAKRAADAAAKSDEKLATVARPVGEEPAPQAGAAPGARPEPPHRPKLDIGTVAAIGVAVGGISAAIGALLSAFFGLGFWMPAGVIGLMLLISGPSMAVAWLKLRKRNLGPLLDANGWAVNAQAKVNVPLGATLTRLAALPPGARRVGADPFADRRQPWRVYLVLAIVVALGVSWYLGKLDHFLPEVARSVTVLGVNAPSYVRPTPAVHTR